MADLMSFMNLNMVLSLVLFSLSIVIPCFVVLLGSVRFSFSYVPELLLKYALFFNVGCLFITGFMGQFLYGPEIAECLGWGWSPFQYELGFSELCLGILGLISPIFHREFWIATIIGSVVWLLGGSGVHLYYLIVEGNEAVLNGSFVIGWNILISLWLVGLYIIVVKTTYQGTTLIWEPDRNIDTETLEFLSAE